MADRRTGLTKAATGQLDPLLSLTNDGASYISQAHLKNVEVIRQAKTFTFCTPVAGVAPGTALSTTPPLTVYNPINSGVYLAVGEVGLGYISGTLGGGAIVLAGNPSLVQAAPTGGTPLTPQCNFLGFVVGKALGYQGATLAATPGIICPVFTIGAWVGTTPDMMALSRDFAGSYLLAPGASISLQAIAGAGTSPLVLLSMSVEEVSI